MLNNRLQENNVHFGKFSLRPGNVRIRIEMKRIAKPAMWMSVLFGGLLMPAMLAAGCSGNSTSSNSAAVKTDIIEPRSVSDTESDTCQDVPMDPVPTPAQDDDDHYVFYDPSVENAVAQYFQKEPEDLEPSDLERLKNLTVFEFWEGGLTSLRDLPALFPKLRYVDLGTYNSSTFSEEDMRLLEGMKDLRGISLFTNRLPSLQSTSGLAYVDIVYSEEGYLSAQNNLSEMSVLGKEFVQDSLVGNIKEYLRITEADKIYELFCTDFIATDNEFEAYYETKLFISQQDGDDFRLIEDLDVPERAGNASGGLIFADVDYDNYKDILIKKGHLGTQGLVAYTCYLWRDGGYVLNESFSSIANPSLDSENKKILSTWRNWAASHSWAMYAFTDGLFRETDRLTEAPESDNTEDWKYITEKYRDGEVVGTEVYLTRDYTEDEIKTLFYDEEGFWGLNGDKWNTLNNLGSYNGFGIYNSTSIDAQIRGIVESVRSNGTSALG